LPKPPETTYFGLWSARDINRVSSLLEELHVRFEINTEQNLPKDRLEAWLAWDEGSHDPHMGFHLWIQDEDVPRVGTKIVDLFPLRKFELDSN
jgi:hypothetical protein